MAGDMAAKVSVGSARHPSAMELAAAEVASCKVLTIVICCINVCRPNLLPLQLSRRCAMNAFVSSLRTKKKFVDSVQDD